MSTDVSQDADASHEVMMGGGVQALQVTQNPLAGGNATSSQFPPTHTQQEFRTQQAVPGAFQAAAFGQQQQQQQQLFAREDAAAANGSNGTNGTDGASASKTSKASNAAQLLGEDVPTFTNTRRRSNSFSRSRASSLPVAPKALPLRREQTKLLKSATRATASPITTDHISQHLHGLSMTSSSPVPTTTATPATTAASVGASVRTQATATTAAHNGVDQHQQQHHHLHPLQQQQQPQMEAQPSQGWEAHAAWDSRPRAHTLAALANTAMDTDTATRARRNSRASAKARSRSSRATAASNPSNPDSASEDEGDDAGQRPRRVCHNERERSRRKNLRQCFLRCQQVTPSVAHDRNVADRILLQETRDHVIRLQQEHQRLTKDVRDLEFELLVAKDGHPDIFGEDRADTQKLAEHLTRTSIGRSMQGAELLLKAMEEADDTLDTSYHGSTEHSTQAADASGNDTRRARGGYTVGRRQRQVTV